MNRDDLFDQFLQRSLTRAEAEQLKALLKRDAEAGRAFVEHVSEASLIVRVGSQLQSAPARAAEIIAPPAAQSAVPFPGRHAGAWKWAALAAGFAVLATAAWMMLSPSPELRATVSLIHGEVTLLRGDETLPAEANLQLRQGDAIQTPPHGRATIVFDGEATRVELQADGRAAFRVSRQGRRVELSQGALEATVAPPPAGQPMTFATLHAEARALGTRFLLSSEISSTRLEVCEGAVEFRRRNHGDSLMVKHGFTATASPNTEFAARPFLPAPWASQDIGAVGLRGRARFDGTVFRVCGAGQDTCCQKDQLHFVYQPLEGDGEIRACVRDVEFTDPEAKSSLMIRQSLKSASPQVSLGLTAAGALEFEHRSKTESRIEKAGRAPAPCWLRLARRGDRFATYKSADGTNWTETGACAVAMPGRVFIGLGVTSYNHAALSASIFEQVSVKAGATASTEAARTF
jgi:ferric-dicitrate binding protein FerR (iron transport regulator)